MKINNVILLFIIPYLINNNSISHAGKIKGEWEFTSHQQRKQGKFTEKQEEKLHKTRSSKKSFPNAPLAPSIDFPFGLDMRENTKTRYISSSPLWNLQFNNTKFIGILLLTSIFLPVVQGTSLNESIIESKETKQAPTTQITINTGELNSKNSYVWEHHPSIKNPTLGYSQKIYKIPVGTPLVIEGLQFQPVLESRDNKHYVHLSEEYNPTRWAHHDPLKLSYPLSKIFLHDAAKNEDVIVEDDIESHPGHPYTPNEEYEKFNQVIWSLDGNCLKPLHNFRRKSFWKRPDGTLYDLSWSEPEQFPLNKIEHFGFNNYTDYSRQVIKLGIYNEVMGYKNLYDDLEVEVINYHYNKEYTLLKNNDNNRTCSYKLEEYVIPNNKQCGFLGTMARNFVMRNETVTKKYKFIKIDPGTFWNSYVYARCGEKFGEDGKEVTYNKKLQDEL